MAGTFTVTGMAAGLQSGEKIIGPISATGSSTIGTIVDATLSSGDNTFTVPSGAVAVLIVFPTSMSATVKVRTSGDTGGCSITPQNGANFAVLPLPSTVSTLILNASGAVSLPSELTFI